MVLTHDVEIIHSAYVTKYCRHHTPLFLKFKGGIYRKSKPEVLIENMILSYITNKYKSLTTYEYQKSVEFEKSRVIGRSRGAQITPWYNLVTPLILVLSAGHFKQMTSDLWHHH